MNAPTVTVEQVEACIVEKEVKTIELVGKKHTLVAVRLKNGFTCVETTTCVSSENYSEEIGAEICMEKIKGKIWMLEGYVLQDKLAVKGLAKVVEHDAAHCDCCCDSVL